jgi:D-alanyl-D-alanine carboxypeptidase
MLKIIGIIVLLICIVIFVFAYIFAPNEKKILDFIKNNPERSALLLLRNDTIVAQHNIDKLMPLASTVKIIIAIEYAEQASKGIINPDELIAISDLDRYYVKNTDGDAHPNWLKSVALSIKNDSISIREIAKGIIKHSSNANTEWLLEKLNLENVNARLDSLGLSKHTPIYHFVSALFIGKEAFSSQNKDEKVLSLKNLSSEEYINLTNIIHEKLKTDTTYKQDLGDLDLNIQRIWSDRLPNSTVDEYVRVMKKINSRTYFDTKTQQYLDEVMEFILENPKNSEWLAHCGMKGGSTTFVLTKALYATDKKGNKTELAYFLNDLSTFETIKLKRSMNEFELKVLKDGISFDNL